MTNNLSIHVEDYSKKELHTECVNLHGYHYLNHLFFKRHKRLLYKPIRLRMIILTTLFFLLYAIIEIIYPISFSVIEKIPALVLPMYFMNISEKLTNALFLNCDVYLLHFNYYRNKGTILKNFILRLGYLLKYNILLTILLCVYSSLILYLLEVSLFEHIMLHISLLCFTVFFCIHYLFSYYVFQPYSADLEIKRPLMNIINSIIYFVAYTLIHIEGTIIFVSILLFITILYSIIALILVYIKAPKTFYLK